MSITNKNVSKSYKSHYGACASNVQVMLVFVLFLHTTTRVFQGQRLNMQALDARMRDKRHQSFLEKQRAVQTRKNHPQHPNLFPIQQHHAS